MTEHELLGGLNSFALNERQAALNELRRQCQGKTETKTSTWTNMHMHSFFSYNGEGWSPSRLVWETQKAGLYAMGLVDFDVLEGLSELFAASDLVGVRAAAGFESRTFFNEYSQVDINSPGEPGVFYFMGTGFVAEPMPGSAAARTLESMLTQAHRRNRGVVARVNAGLGELQLDYEKDVLPLTPAGNATERHIVTAYFNKAMERAGNDRQQAADFWAAKLRQEPAEMRALIQNVNAFVDMLRGKLMKKGGLGYEQPTRETFPVLDDVVSMILECRAIPCSTWLDGTSAGESEPQAQLECLMAKGVAMVNIIPDRNWNLKNPDEKARKVQELQRYAETARQLGLPIIAGTELNKPGQRLVDDFDAEPLKPLLPLFIEGAQVLIGHTRLLRYADYSYTDRKVQAEFKDIQARNKLFAAVGALPPPTVAVQQTLAEMEVGEAFAALRESAKAGAWTIR